MNANQEIQMGARFKFGANWTRFLSTLDDERIAEAESSLREMLGVASLDGQQFLDIGCGSGLFSLAARRLGASVHSFDFDPQSVACTQELKRRYFPGDHTWRVETGSVLDHSYLDSLGQFGVVYSWGVLHHTGAMWLAIENAIDRVAAPAGKLFIAIYNDQGWKSHVWWLVKFFYNQLPQMLRRPFVFITMTITKCLVIIRYTFQFKLMTAIAPLLKDRQGRGMSAKYDEIDWIGGFPYEFASFETLAAYFRTRGFSMVKFKRNPGLGCHEMVLQRTECAK